MRAATGGLAASERTIPPSIMAPTATRMDRSIVHHHAANGVRSARETMIELPELWRGGFETCESPARLWLRAVKKKFQFLRMCTVNPATFIGWPGGVVAPVTARQCSMAGLFRLLIAQKIVRHPI